MDTLSDTIQITLPTFHPEQARCFRQTNGVELIAVRAGRRWGKNVLGETEAADAAIKGETVGWFAPRI